MAAVLSTRVITKLTVIICGAVIAFIVARSVFLVSQAWPFITDDAFITLRYARNLANGHGFVFNPGGMPLEGYSNFLLVLISAASFSLSLEPILVIRVLSLISVVGTSVLMFLLARRWTPPLIALIPAYVLTAYWGMILWTVSGLETAIYQFLVLLTIHGAVRCIESAGCVSKQVTRSRYSNSSVLLFSAAALLTALMRPEGVAIGVISGAVVAWSRGILSAFGKHIAISEHNAYRVRFLKMSCVFFALPYIIYFSWRWFCFGRLLPNPVTCKAFYEGSPWILLSEFWEVAKFYIVPAAAIAWHKVDRRYVLLLLIPGSYAAMLFGTDPIIGYGNRHFLAAMALLLVGSAVGLNSAASYSLSRVNPFIRDLLVLSLVIVLVGSSSETGDRLAAWSKRYEERMSARQTLADWLNNNLEPGDRYVIGDSGLVPFSTSAIAIDAFCINNLDATSEGIERNTGKLVDKILHDSPEAIIVHSMFAEVLEPRPEYGFYPALLARSGFKDNYLPAKVIGASKDDFFYWVFFNKEFEKRRGWVTWRTSEQAGDRRVPEDSERGGL